MVAETSEKMLPVPDSKDKAFVYPPPGEEVDGESTAQSKPRICLKLILIAASPLSNSNC